MTHDASQSAASASQDAPQFPHHAANTNPSLEPAERPSNTVPRGVPRWQPEDGDFS
jgi:hypothetical protein